MPDPLCSKDGTRVTVDSAGPLNLELIHTPIKRWMDGFSWVVHALLSRRLVFLFRNNAKHLYKSVEF